MGASLVVLFAGLVVGTFGSDVMGRYAPDAIGNRLGVAATIVVSALALFGFLLSAYFRLTNARVTRREVLPGAIVGAVALELALQGLRSSSASRATSSPCGLSARRSSSSSGSTCSPT